MSSAEREELKTEVKAALEDSGLDGAEGLVEGLGAEDLLDLLPLLLL